MKRTVSEITLTLLLIGMLTFAFNIQRVWASETIYIRADGSIDPPSAPISTVDNITYTFTDNIYDSIVVERDNVIIDGAGYTVQGIGQYDSRGIGLYEGGNTTVKNTNINNFWVGISVSSNNNIIFGNNITNNVPGIILYGSNNIIVENNITNNSREGIYLWGPSGNNTISRNNITNCWCGIGLDYSRGSNTISANTITTNSKYGIRLYYSFDNSLSRNNIANNRYGIGVDYSSGNTISGNNITTNDEYGIELWSSSGNKLYHNNFMDNTQQVFFYWSGYANVWDDSYPSGGNYWSDYTGVDADRDGIGDSPYIIDADNQDRYPLIHPWNPLPVHNINTGLGYAKIQEAINAPETLNGHTIFVEAGTYYENVVISKTLSLLGEDKSATFIDGRGIDTVVTLAANNSMISGFTIQESGVNETKFIAGIFLNYTNYCTITNNNILNNQEGITLIHSSNNIIAENNIVNNSEWGISLLFYSSDNTITGNEIRENAWTGIFLLKSSNNTISENNIKSNYEGLYLSHSSDHNAIFQNNVENNNYGFYFFNASHNNSIYHNNIINNTEQVYDYAWESLEPGWIIPSINVWDDGYPSGGNLWSDYTGIDSDFDGIGDTQYVIDSNNIDNYPLMGRFSDFTATPQNHVQTVCNSTISSFQFNDTAIIFNVSGEVGTTGFCRICIPTALMSSPLKVLVDEIEIPYTLLPCSNSTHNYLYFTYVHSAHEIVITSAYTLTITATVGGTTNPSSGTYSYTANSIVQVTAIPNANYQFDYWELDGANVGSANPYQVLMDNNHKLKAVFSPIPPPKPVGGHSIQMEGYAPTQPITPITPYLALIAILTIGFTTIRRKATRKTK